MKKIITLALFTALSLTAFSQKLEVDKVNEFTGFKTRLTSAEPLIKNMKGTAYISFKQVESSYVLRLRYMGAYMKPVSVSEGDLLYFILDDGSILKIPANSYTMSAIGAGAIGMGGSRAIGINIPYTITEKILRELQTHLIKKFRIDFSDSYVEHEADEKRAQLIQNTAKLINVNK